MSRRSLLVVLFVAIAIWVLSALGASSVLAKDSERALASVPLAPASAVLDDEACPQVEPVTQDVTSQDYITLASEEREPEPLVDSGLDIKQQPVLGEAEVSWLQQITTGSHEIIVAVLDTGLDQNHEELSGQVVAETNLSQSLTPGDVHGHGTHVAGIIAARDDGQGVTGIAPDCLLLNVKVADDTGRCQAQALARGIKWAVANGASVINISIEIREPSAELEEAVNYAWSQGCLVVAAAGNDGSELPVYPAYYENCLAVAAAGPGNGLAPLSNYGDWVDVIAPGFEIYSTLPDGGYGCKTGTSFACAYVSGLGALLFDVVTDTSGSSWLNDEVRAIIESGCQQGDLIGIANSD